MAGTEPSPDRILGIQMSPISMLHEGCDHVYRLLREEVGLNAVFIYSSTYQIPHWDRHKHGNLATDHGVTPPDFDYGDTRNTWFEPNPQYYRNAPFIRSDDEGRLFADRDVFRESLEAAGEHGFQVYGRALEAEFGSNVVPGWAQVCTIDCYGRATNRPCPNHPGYQAFWVAVMEDLFKSYPNLAGFKFGAERPGPLALALFNGPGFWYSKNRPDCFCEHCRNRNEGRGIDTERALLGYRRLHEFTSALQAGTADSRDGALTGCLRILIEYPEILAHHREFIRALEELHARLAGVVRNIRPGALFGLHVYQGATAWDFTHRATLDYRAMAEYVDFLKPVIYQNAAGPRMATFIDSVKDGSFADFDEEGIAQLLFRIQGYQGPRFADMKSRQEGFDTTYVYQETKRCVDELAGRALTLAGPGFDIGGPKETDTPEFVYETIAACFQAGADGLIVSREYDEMQRPNLQAVGRAIRDHA